MQNVRMVLEGGAFRGLFTAGILDVLMENKIKIDEIVGTSAGGLFGVNYFSNQKGRAIRYNKKYCNDKRYMSIKSLLTTGNYINKDFAFYKITKDLDPFDSEIFIKSKKRFYVVATNIETGNPKYFKISDPYKDMEKLRATSAIPIISKNVEINGKKYLDGGISDSIPIHFNKEKYNKNIVILTQPLNYKKECISKSKQLIIKMKYRKYPKLIKLLLNRHIEYNKRIKEIMELEKNQEIFVIRPNKSINIKLNEKKPEKYQQIYDMGVQTANKILEDLKKYLKG